MSAIGQAAPVSTATQSAARPTQVRANPEDPAVDLITLPENFGLNWNLLQNLSISSCTVQPLTLPPSASAAAANPLAAERVANAVAPVITNIANAADVEPQVHRILPLPVAVAVVMDYYAEEETNQNYLTSQPIASTAAGATTTSVEPILDSDLEDIYG